MYYFEIMNTRKVTPVTRRHYYPEYIVIQMPAMHNYLVIEHAQARIAFFKLQGEILGSMVGEC